MDGAPARSNALTAVGRQLEADIGTAQGALLKWLVTHRRLGPVRRHGLQVAGACVAAKVGRELWGSRKFLLAVAVAVCRHVREKGIVTTVYRLFSAQDGQGEGPHILQASAYKLFASEDGSVMWRELTGSTVVTLATSFVMVRKAFLLGRLIDLQNSLGLQNSPNDRSLWRWYAWQFPLNALLVTLLQEFSGHIRAYMVLKWRRNVTRKLHDLYFSQMGYYRLHNCDSQLQIHDPDVRICRSVQEMCEANANMAFSLCNSFVFTAAFGQAVIRGRDWKWSLLTPTFFFLAIKVVTMCEPVARWAMHHAEATLEAKYSQLLTRMQLHAERITMLQGEGFEMSLLRKQIQGIYHTGRKLRYLLFKRNVVDGVVFTGGFPTLLEQTAWLMGSVMGANDVVAGAAMGGQLASMPLDLHTPYHHTSGTLGVIVTNLWAFFNTCNSWGALSGAYFTLRNVDTSNTRVHELYSSLLALRSESRRESERVFLDQGPVISFDGVAVDTPVGQRLLRDLSFRVEEGQALLICGHNGSGKSSIIRCLCALWPVAEGSITRPGGATCAEDDAQLHKEMYYLPQKPCNVLGSLADQLTYPERVDLPEEELRRWLRYVDLEYLADRKIGRDAASRVQSSVLASAQEAVSSAEGAAGEETDWELLLSLGEQQALSIARMLYHCPRFAVLDECTSAVSRTLERRLFEVAREIGISCISITHRPALKEHHEQMLTLTGRLEADGRGWRHEDLPAAASLPAVRPRPEGPEEVHRRMEAYLAQRQEGAADAAPQHELEALRSERYAQRALEEPAASAEAMVRGRWRSSLARVAAVVRLGLQRPGARRAALGRLLLTYGLLRLRVSIGWRTWRGQLSMVSAGICGDKALIFCELAANLACTALCQVVEQWLRIEVQNLTADLWYGATTELQDRLVRNAAFQEVMNPPGPQVPAIENPMQRLTELRRLFGMLSHQFMSIAMPMSQALYLMPMMFRGVGLWAPLLMALNYVAFRLAQLVAPDFAKIQAMQTTLESRFQVLHTRLKTIAEPVAFSGAGAAERRIIEPRFHAIMDFERLALRKQFCYNAVVQYFTEYSHLPMWTHRIMAVRYVSSNNPQDPRGLTPANVVANVLFDRCTQFAQIWVQRCVTFMPQWRRIDAHCIRVLELVAACELAGSSGATATAGELPPGADDLRISARGLDLVAGRSRCLAQGLSFELLQGEPTLVTGPNASGKSLLGSVLLGLCPPAGEEAHVSVAGAPGTRPPLRTLMPAPQRIYLPVGTLFAQLLYPRELASSFGRGLAVKLVAYDFPRPVTQEELRRKFVRFGAGKVEVVEDTRESGGVMTFASLELALQALARPQDHKMGADGFLVDIQWAEPGPPGEQASFVRMRNCLRTVDIDNVLTREGKGWLTERAWEDVLSGGEQQRLCFARVLYHGPAFALLDECTSMVAADSEAGLYQRLFENWGITPLTLTQRLFMPDLYQRELKLGVRSLAGWELVAARLEAASPAGS